MPFLSHQNTFNSKFLRVESCCRQNLSKLSQSQDLLLVSSSPSWWELDKKLNYFLSLKGKIKGPYNANTFTFSSGNYFLYTYHDISAAFIFLLWLWFLLSWLILQNGSIFWNHKKLTEFAQQQKKKSFLPLWTDCVVQSFIRNSEFRKCNPNEEEK